MSSGNNREKRFIPGSDSFAERSDGFCVNSHSKSNGNDVKADNEFNKAAFDESDVLLQKELDAMRKDVPPVPESFRSAWRQAVRDDAANMTQATNVSQVSKTAQADKLTPAFNDYTANVNDSGTTPIEPVNDNSGVIDSFLPPVNRQKSKRLRSVIPILSSVAVLIFLIGGTLATRNTLSPRLKNNTAGKYTAVSKSPRDSLVDEDMREETAAEAVEESADEFEETDIAAEAAEESSEEFEESAPAAAAGGFYENAYSAAMNAEKGSDSYAERRLYNSIHASSDKMDSGITSSYEHPETASEKKSLEDISETETGFRAEIKFFFEDMGAFILAAIPWLAGIAILCLITTLILKNKKKHHI